MQMTIFETHNDAAVKIHKTSHNNYSQIHLTGIIGISLFIYIYIYIFDILYNIFVVKTIVVKHHLIASRYAFHFGFLILHTSDVISKNHHYQ